MGVLTYIRMTAGPGGTAAARGAGVATWLAADGEFSPSPTSSRGENFGASASAKCDLPNMAHSMPPDVAATLRSMPGNNVCTGRMQGKGGVRRAREKASNARLPPWTNACCYIRLWGGGFGRRVSAGFGGGVPGCGDHSMRLGVAVPMVSAAWRRVPCARSNGRLTLQ